VSDHALRVLEFPRVLEAVAGRAGSTLGRSALLAVRPGVDRGATGRELARVEETLRILREHPEWAPPLPPDARGPLRTLHLADAVLDPPGLLLLGHLLEGSELLAASLVRMAKADESAPDGPDPREKGREGRRSAGLLGKLRSRLPVLPEESGRIREILDQDGRVRDGASPDLRRIRRKLTDARNRIVRRLEAFLDGLPDRLRVPDASVSVREGRYVVPIRREGRSEVGGVVLGESGTGATLFVEPPLASQLMNELLELERADAAEIQRILRTATERLRPYRDKLEEGLGALVEFDTLWARALVARDWEASLPELLEPEEEGIRVIRGRHPLLVELGAGEVVPFDLELAPGERAVVVSGPNTGGKTVLLKALGLIVLLARSGILPPVGPGTRLPVFRRVLADIGDEQSIAESLSTFSAHLANAREIVEAAAPGTLVLIDEMGTGTDPAEGAALGRGIR
jgi:DNA mismatch repair protein MutS2